MNDPEAVSGPPPITYTSDQPYPPRWRFGFVRDALKLLEGAPRVSQKRRTEVLRDALEHLDSLEATLIPAIPSIQEFEAQP